LGSTSAMLTIWSLLPMAVGSSQQERWVPITEIVSARSTSSQRKRLPPFTQVT